MIRSLSSVIFEDLLEARSRVVLQNVRNSAMREDPVTVRTSAIDQSADFPGFVGPVFQRVVKTDSSLRWVRNYSFHYASPLHRLSRE